MYLHHYRLNLWCNGSYGRLEVQFQSFAEIIEGFPGSFALARNVNFQTLSYEPFALLPYACAECLFHCRHPFVGYCRASSLPAVLPRLVVVAHLLYVAWDVALVDVQPVVEGHGAVLGVGDGARPGGLG